MSGSSLILLSPCPIIPVRMADVALLIANQYPWLNIVDMGNPEPLTR